MVAKTGRGMDPPSAYTNCSSLALIPLVPYWVRTTRINQEWGYQAIYPSLVAVFSSTGAARGVGARSVKD